MASQIPDRRKQRTRDHVIADLSVHHVEGFILKSSYSAQKLGSDYGYDLMMWTFDHDGYIEPGIVYFQCKAMEELNERGSHYAFDLDIRDYNLWLREGWPVILVLFDAAKNRAYWLPVQSYFEQAASRQPRQGAKTVRVRIARSQVMNRRAIATIRNLK